MANLNVRKILNEASKQKLAMFLNIARTSLQDVDPSILCYRYQTDRIDHAIRIKSTLLDKQIGMLYTDGRDIAMTFNYQAFHRLPPRLQTELIDTADKINTLHFKQKGRMNLNEKEK